MGITEITGLNFNSDQPIPLAANPADCYENYGRTLEKLACVDKERSKNADFANSDGDTLELTGREKITGFKKLFYSIANLLPGKKINLSGSDRFSLSSELNHLVITTLNGNDKVKVNAAKSLKAGLGDDDDDIIIGSAVQKADVSLGKGDDLAVLNLSDRINPNQPWIIDGNEGYDKARINLNTIHNASERVTVIRTNADGTQTDMKYGTYSISSDELVYRNDEGCQYTILLDGKPAALLKNIERIDLTRKQKN